MAIKVLGFDGTPFNPDIHCSAAGDRFIRALLQLVFSGNYVTHGDALDLTNGGGTPAVPTTVPPAVSRGAGQIYIEGRGPTAGFSQAGGYMVVANTANSDAPLNFTDVQNLKVTLWKNVAGVITEYTAGAYGADVTGDVFTAEVIWVR